MTPAGAYRQPPHDGTLPADLAAAVELGGEMGRLFAEFDWSAHPLGPPVQWSAELRAALAVVLTSRFPIVLWLGPDDLFVVYNDAYSQILGENIQRRSVGPGSEVWWDIWEPISPMLASVIATGQATWSFDLMLPMVTAGRRTERYFTFTYSPLIGAAGVNTQYRGFCQLLAEQLSAAMASAVGYEQERQRADALAELDRAKTALLTKCQPRVLRPVDAVVPASADELSTARHRLRDWLATIDVGSSRITDILLAVGEAVINAIEHGSGGDPRRTVSIEAFLRDGSLAATVTDSGSWTVDSSASRRSQQRGRGLTLINGLADHVDTVRTTQGTRITLRFDHAVGSDQGANL